MRQTVQGTEHHTGNVATAQDALAGPWLHYASGHLVVRANEAKHGDGGAWIDQGIVEDLGEVGVAELRAADIEDAHAKALALAAEHGWRVMAREPYSYRDSASGRRVHGPGRGSAMLPFDKGWAIIDLAESTNPEAPRLMREHAALYEEGVTHTVRVNVYDGTIRVELPSDDDTAAWDDLSEPDGGVFNGTTLEPWGEDEEDMNRADTALSEFGFERVGPWSDEEYPTATIRRQRGD